MKKYNDLLLLYAETERKYRQMQISYYRMCRHVKKVEKRCHIYKVEMERLRRKLTKIYAHISKYLNQSLVDYLKNL